MQTQHKMCGKVGNERCVEKGIILYCNMICEKYDIFYMICENICESSKRSVHKMCKQVRVKERVRKKLLGNARWENL